MKKPTNPGMKAVSSCSLVMRPGVPPWQPRITYGMIRPDQQRPPVLPGSGGRADQNGLLVVQKTSAFNPVTSRTRCAMCDSIRNGK